MKMDSDTFSALVAAVVLICAGAVAAAVCRDFIRYNDRSDVRRQKRTPVATGTMLLFFALYYWVVRFQRGEWRNIPAGPRTAMIFSGLALLVLGTFVNLEGRASLGANWANHIKIYDGHTLVTDGPFRYVRHPLYSSLFAMCYGGSLIYANWLSAALTTALFVPMMTWRAKQEETLLAEAFPEYALYRERTGRFFPKIRFHKEESK